MDTSERTDAPVNTEHDASSSQSDRETVDKQRLNKESYKQKNPKPKKMRKNTDHETQELESKHQKTRKLHKKEGTDSDTADESATKRHTRHLESSRHAITGDESMDTIDEPPPDKPLVWSADIGE